MKLALVKQDVYSDLYVAPYRSSDPLELLKSSIMRVGPIGLFEVFESEFIIVKTEPDEECQVFQSAIKGLRSDYYRQVAECPMAKVEGREFMQPGSEVPQGQLAVPCHDVDWGAYDVVLSINVSLPSKLIKRYPRTLFAYMMGEANKRHSRWPKWGYDLVLTQNLIGALSKGVGTAVDFPYTFLGPKTLESIVERYLGRPSLGEGIYSEINMSDERPVERVPNCLQAIEKSGRRIRLHKQNVMENLTELYDSKYFVKIGGRRIRGNSVIEAISSGTLFIGDPNLLYCPEIVPDRTVACDVESLSKLIDMFDADDALYQEALDEQRLALEYFVYKRPIECLKNALNQLRALHLNNRKLKRTFLKLPLYMSLRYLAGF